MKFQRTNFQSNEIPTASMPDIVFLLLFFFMVSATIKPQENLVDVKQPEAQATMGVKKKFLIKELKVGMPKDPSLGKSPRISADGTWLEVNDLGQWVAEKKEEIGEAHKEQMIVLLKADHKVEMGFITDIQEELRKHNARKILYRTLDEAL